MTPDNKPALDDIFGEAIYAPEGWHADVLLQRDFETGDSKIGGNASGQGQDLGGVAKVDGKMPQTPKQP